MRKMKPLNSHIKMLLFAFILFVSALTAQNKFAYTTKPFLQNMSRNSVAVFWEVNGKAASWVEFGENENLGSKAFNSTDGMKDISDGIQKVNLKNLKPGKQYFYKVFSAEIKTHEPYNVVYGDTIQSAIYKFFTPPEKLKSFSFLTFNDIHNKPQFIEQVVKRENDFNFAVFNGDVITDLNDESDFSKLAFAPFAEYFAAEKPFYFVRGNHETRGGAARSFKKYIDTPSEKFYFTFTYGEVFFIALDCGEDKTDDNKYYYGLADFDKYRSEEAKWLEGVVKSKEFKQAKFRIAFLHTPIINQKPDSGKADYGMIECGKKFAPILNKAKIDLLLAGHTHQYQVIKPSRQTNNFPVIIGGAPFKSETPEKTTYTKVEISSEKVVAYLKNYKGELIEKIEIKK